MYAIIIDPDSNRDVQEFLQDTLQWAEESGMETASYTFTDEHNTRAWLIETRPKVVHYVGIRTELMVTMTKSLNIAFITGVHSFAYTPTDEYACYCTSENVARNNTTVLYPVSSMKPFKTTKRYVTIFHVKEVHMDILLDCVTRLQHIPFMFAGVDEECRGKLSRAIASRPQGSARCEFLPTDYDTEKVFSETKLLLLPYDTSLFSRMASHALATRTPIIATDIGYNSIMLRDAAVLMAQSATIEEWRDTVRKCETDTALALLRGSIVERSERYSVSASKQVFNSLIRDAMLPKADILIVTQWGDEGVGVQARNYAKFFLDCGARVSVLSYRSKWSQGNDRKFQVSTDEWNFPNIEVQYSEHFKEELTKYEILGMIQRHKVCHVLFVGDWSAYLNHILTVKNRGIWVYGTQDPPESVTWDKNILDLGYSINGVIPSSKKPPIKPLKFLCICGANENDRKRATLVCRAFLEVLRTYGPVVSLTLTTFSKIDLSEWSKTSGINVIQRPVSRSEIRDLFQSHHVLVNVSQSEVLAADIYEATSTGTSVLTLDAPPYNQLVDKWLLQCHRSQDGNGVLFRLVDLVNKIVQVKDEYNEEEMSRVMLEYKKRFSSKSFKQRISKLFYLT